ncbi:MAG: hypothetical protein ACOX4I_04975 [Anaerovoracaceae bacterium]|jgi:hypothetical protein
MEKELQYFEIEGSYGGCQDWFRDFMMKIGGCAAATACDSSICFDLYKGTDVCPVDVHDLSIKTYRLFSRIMKPYLRPRWRGVDKLEIYIDGFTRYLRDKGETTISMTPLHGSCSFVEAAAALRKQIDDGWPIPILTLHHSDPDFSFYEWHWYLLTGYRTDGERLMAKAVTYGSWRWLDFERLWDTGYEEKGGLVLYHRD